MRRWWALAGAAAVLVLAAAPVAAAPAAPAPAPAPASNSVPVDAVALSVAQVKSSGLAVTLDPGATEPHDLIVSNHTSDLRLTVKLSATDATGNLGVGAGSWVSFGDDAIQLDPHSATSVSMKVAVPHDTQPGQALAHVNATVVSAVAAADGAPRAGTAQATFPIAITIRGTSTEQVAVADVHRVDQGKQHSLAIVLRNFSAKESAVSGHVRVATAKPQELRFDAKLPATQDTTVTLPWNAPPEGTPTDISVDVEYEGGNVAAWSSTLGGPPQALTPTSAQASTDATAPGSNSDGSSSTDTQPAAATASSSKPWWSSLVVPGIVLGIILGGMWFLLEMKRAKRREQQMPYPPYFMGGPGYGGGGGGDASAELAKQLVKLTEIIVALTTEGTGAISTPARARSPGHDPPANAPPVYPVAHVAPSRRDRDSPEADPDPTPFAVPLVRSAFPAPGVEPRPETDDVPRATPAAETRAKTGANPDPKAKPRPAPAEWEAEWKTEAEWDPAATALKRLTELDRQRRQFRQFMDSEEEAEHLEFPRHWEIDSTRQSLFDDEDDTF